LAKIDYEESQEFVRSWPLLASMAVGMGIGDNELDDLFRLGATYRNQPSIQ